jgi:hypothetical protein
MKAKKLPGCMSMGGTSPRTGNPVWSRHSWSGAWGEGRCRFCGYTLDDLRREAERREKAQAA